MKKEFKGHANKGGVYQIINIVNGKKYIGSAKTFKTRAAGHASSLKTNKHQNKHLQASWNKYGADAFLFEVVEVVGGDKAARTTREQELINEQLDNWKRCFNFKKKTVKKQGPWSSTPEETRKKLSKAMKGKNLGKKHSEKTRRAISENSKKMWETPEVREKILKRKNKIEQSEPYKTKQSQISKDNWKNEDIRNARVEGLRKSLNKKHYKDKQSRISKARWQNPEYKEKISLSTKKQWENPDYKASMIEKIKQANSKTWIFIEPKGSRVLIKNLKAYCEKKNLSYFMMRKLATGKTQQYKGWKTPLRDNK